MPFKTSLCMTWLIWLSHCIIFQIRNRNNELSIDILSHMLSFICFFLFNQSQNNAVLEPRTRHFRGLAGIEAKDFSFEAKTSVGKTRVRVRTRVGLEATF